MTIWTVLKNDHADIIAIGHTILRGTDKGALRTREPLVSEMANEIEAHFEAEEDGLFDALKGKEEVRELVLSLRAEHEEIEEELARLARIGKKNTIEWASRFEDFTYLLDQHFHREEHELFPHAETLLTREELHGAMHEYIQGKTEEIWNRHRRFGLRPAAIWAGAAVVVAGLALAAGRKGYFRRLFSPRPELGDHPQKVVRDHSPRKRKQRETDPLAPLGGEA